MSAQANPEFALRPLLPADAPLLADIFRASVVDSTLESFVFEITGTPEKIDAFAELMRPLGLVDVARTGVAALAGFLFLVAACRMMKPFFAAGSGPTSGDSPVTRPFASRYA